MMKWRKKIEPLNQNSRRLRVLSIQAKRIYPETEDEERENGEGIFTSEAKAVRIFPEKLTGNFSRK